MLVNTVQCTRQPTPSKLKTPNCTLAQSEKPWSEPHLKWGYQKYLAVTPEVNKTIELTYLQESQFLIPHWWGRKRGGGDYLYIVFGSSLVAQIVTSPLAMQETQVQSLGLEDPLEKENGNPLQYSCMENPMDRGAWRETVHGVTKELDMSEWVSLVYKSNKYR